MLQSTAADAADPSMRAASDAITGELDCAIVANDCTTIVLQSSFGFCSYVRRCVTVL